ncbi:hypothetical protein CBER1_00982 [Cercospora berteroae]|uniref:Uncharacterized protein n=1 Tax=Cercospora berteroae TaxID=357750 RepID=A0A2S6C0U5_9PEZI|nr:hypothetical protein CBER1_00982 [Cercospora berteroae]
MTCHQDRYQDFAIDISSVSHNDSKIEHRPGPAPFCPITTLSADLDESTAPSNHKLALRIPRANTDPKMGIINIRRGKSAADVKIEEITELYATAQDEFEIAMEETEKASIYAEDDRKAAREELTRVQEAYKAVLDGTDQDLANEVKRRIGQRIRELEQGVVAMEELALNQD